MNRDYALMKKEDITPNYKYVSEKHIFSGLLDPSFSSKVIFKIIWIDYNYMTPKYRFTHCNPMDI